MNKKYSYFDGGKSIVENVYYLLMILSIIFVAIQVIIARDSLNHSTQLELIRHTIEQNNRYRIAFEAKAEEFALALRQGRYPVSEERIAEVMMQPINLKEMTLEQGMGLVLFSDSVMADPVELEKLFQIQNDLATELDQYAFFVLSGFLFEELAYRDMGYNFMRCTNLSAVPAIYVQSYSYYNLHQINVYRNVRQLYDIWWYREQIDKRRNRIAMCHSILAGDEREMEFLRQGEVAELSLSPDSLHSVIRQAETEMADLEKVLAEKLKQATIRN